VTAEANDRIVRDFLLLWEQRDTEQLVAICTEDAVWEHRPLPPEIGRDAIRAFCERFENVPGGPYEILHQVAGDQFVFNERLDRVTVGSGLIELPVCAVFEIEDGRIKAWRDYFDTGGIANR